MFPLAAIFAMVLAVGGTNNVSVVLFGPRGAGKTTLAELMYNNNKTIFKGCGPGEVIFY